MAMLALLILFKGPALAQETTLASVSSIAELKRAVADQAQHIVVKAHLDLSREQPLANESWLLSLQGVQSIRVRCFLQLLSRDELDRIDRFTSDCVERIVVWIRHLLAPRS